MPRKAKAQRTGEERVIQLAAARVQFDPTGTREELQTQLRELAKVIASGLSTLELNQSKELLGVFVSDLFLSVSDRERQEFRCQRQAEGIAAARERGVRFGRKPIPMPEQFTGLAEAWWHGRVTAVQAGKALGISRTTFKHRAEEWCAAAGLGKRAAPCRAEGRIQIGK